MIQKQHLFKHIIQGVLSAACLLAISPRAWSFDTTRTFLPAQFADPVPGTPVERPYWESFGDPVLNTLVEKGMSGNFDLKATAARIAEAEALAKQAAAPLLPSVSAEAGYTLRPYDSVGLGVTIPTGMGAAGVDEPEVIHSLSATLKASYLVDITGRNYLNRQAVRFEVAAGEQDGASQATALVSLIVQTYFEACQAKARHALVEEQIKTNQAFLELVEAQFNAGSATAVDVLQQRQQLDAAKSRLPLVALIERTSRQQLAVLIGEADASTLPELSAELPKVTPLPPTGTPERLLTARADLRAQAIRIDASEQREKSAFRTLLPSLALSGQVGYQMNYSNDVDHGETWSLGALVSVPLYQGGANRAELDKARVATRTETYVLRQAALAALGEVENTLSTVRFLRENLNAIDRQLEAARTAFGEARKRYAVGLSDYLTVLTVLASFQQIQLSKAQAELDVLNARVSYMNALGGQWTKKLTPSVDRRRP